MTNLQAREKLIELAEKDFKEFSAALTPGEDKMLGVRVPNVKALAKQIAQGDWQTFLDNPLTEYHEECLLNGLVIGFIKADIKVVVELFDKWMCSIRNWAICDSAVANLKAFKKPENRDFVWNYLCNKIKTAKEPYDIRACVVALFDFFVGIGRDEQVSQIYGEITNDHYYVKMAVAWGVSVIMIKNYSVGLNLITCKKLPAWTHNKAIQKSCESFRLSVGQKAELKAYKIK